MFPRQNYMFHFIFPELEELEELEEFEEFEEILRKDPRVSRYLKKLTLIDSEESRPLHQIEEHNATLRRLLKRPFSRRSTTIKLLLEDLFYYNLHLLPAIKTLKFNQPGANLFLRAKLIKSHTFLSKCKHINNLITPRKMPISLIKSIRKLRELKYLDISVDDNQISQAHNLFQNLIKLQNVQLLVNQSQGPQDGKQNSQSISRFFKNLISLKSLTKLNLCVRESKLFMDNKLLTQIFEGIGNSNIKEMNIELQLQTPLNFEQPLSNGIKKFLEKLDSLTVDITKWNFRSPVRSKSDFDGFKNNLTVQCAGIGEKDDLKNILNQCTSLKALWVLNETETVLRFGVSIIRKELKIFDHWHSFKNTKMDSHMNLMVKNLQGVKLEVLDIQVMNMDSILFDKILGACQVLDPREVKVFSLVITDDTSKRSITGPEADQIRYMSSDYISQLAQSLAQFKNLEKLKMHIRVGDKNSIQSIEYLLSSLPKIQVLDLFLNSHTSELADSTRGSLFCLSPDKMPELTSLKILLPSGLWIDNINGFFEKATFLKNLKVLHIDTETLHKLPDAIFDQSVDLFTNTFEKLEHFHVSNFAFETKLSLKTNKFEKMLEKFI